ncbi:uncharacterized protein LOC124168183 [Ischnura elegans]|uniref:uncharacterized protein LOC124168183 n=1 Tax=Ischnura elegans TaxID=197161 RepID=UPI001ED8911A|nr:uncharacterized protein LOC124168183 [Ischnura elegans]
MVTSKMLIISAGLLIVIAMTTADRSFYAPGPFNYPGLLPRFGGGSDASQSSNTGGRDQGARRPADNDLGTRIGGDDNDFDRSQRVRPSNSQSSSSCRQQVPCFDCIVYISRTGQITRFNPSRQNDLTRY